jgi:hypothetical protein
MNSNISNISQPAIADLVAGYGAYSSADDLSLAAHSDPPATTIICLTVAITLA